MGLEMVMRRLVETGCTSFLPTVITQRRELYPRVSRYHPKCTDWSFYAFCGRGRSRVARTYWGIMPKGPSYTRGNGELTRKNCSWSQLVISP